MPDDGWRAIKRGVMMLRDLLRLDWRSDDRATEQATEQATEDGREPDWIKPAATNLWYLLATIYGTRGEDQELQAKNRLVWNRFMSKWLNPIQRKNLLDTGRYATVPVGWTASGENKLRLVA